ncbi:MAG: hypothetical protein B6D61_02885 [Bacteroidetes bacterium 4484_249]|nr:MAG: hypothetical protein B6D61_02885 [Bacteroidetes bacterium 4484_249]
MKTQISKSAIELLLAKLFIVSLIMALIVFFTSCNKDDETQPEKPEIDTQTTKDESAAQSEYDDIIVISEEAIDSAYTETYPVTTISIAACATLTSDTVNNTVEVDFGTEGCQGYDGRIRSGKIIVTYIGNYRTPGSAFNVAFDDYTVDGIVVSGSISYYTVSRNEQGNLTFTTQVINGKIEYPDGYAIEYDASFTVEWTQGEATGDIFDDVFEISGNSSGTSSTGVGYTTEITVPITLKTACWNQYIFYPVKGIKVLIPSHEATRTIDFGNGECDKIVTLSVGNYKYTVTLP